MTAFKVIYLHHRDGTSHLFRPSYPHPTPSYITMGCCCSCLKQRSALEAEMTAKPAKAPGGKSLSISRAMSAPTIELDSPCVVSGSGLALAGVSIEQDAAYWEWHVEQVPEKSSSEVMFGVATRKSAAFYKSLDEESGDGAYTSSTCCLPRLMRLFGILGKD